MQERQTAFAMRCIQWLMAQPPMPREGNTGRRLIVVGHSMGGVVARAALSRMLASGTGRLRLLANPIGCLWLAIAYLHLSLI